MAPAVAHRHFVGDRSQCLDKRQHDAAAGGPQTYPARFERRERLILPPAKFGCGPERAEAPRARGVGERVQQDLAIVRIERHGGDGYAGRRGGSSRVGRRGPECGWPVGHRSAPWTSPRRAATLRRVSAQPIPFATQPDDVPASEPTPPQTVPAVRFWSGWSTRARLIAVVLAIDVIAALVSCGVIVINARNAVKVETRASLSTVESLVADTIRLLEAAPAERLLQTLDLRFQVLRHVRVTVRDAEGATVGAPIGQPRPERAAPVWFADLIMPKIEQHELPIVTAGRTIGTARITTQPMDEIDEIWVYARALSLTTFCINAAMLAALYLALGRVLAPLARLADGLTQLERHDYTARLPSPSSHEFAVIATRFNQVAEALSAVRAANGRLKRQLLTAQDDERRSTALELHDEFGPCLFALEANAASIGRLATGAAEPDRNKLSARASEIAGIVSQVQSRNRDLLNRLRPHALGQVPLADCLDLLLRDFARRHPETRFSGHFAGLARGYGDLADLTVFRCIQESTTNAVRHGRAASVTAKAREADGALMVSIADDGAGFDPDHGTGLGLSGMRERVEALDGTFVLDKHPPGAVVRIIIPVDSHRGDDPGSERSA
ncbi:HAMP domain-containing protein [Methylobacterium sp. WL8]|nr:HAMP domain-containing protein [Methylobacterium sp. WL8]